jgi:hypothetical protein
MGIALDFLTVVSNFKDNYFLFPGVYDKAVSVKKNPPVSLLAAGVFATYGKFSCPLGDYC